MAIDRVIPANAALTIPERVARERPGPQPAPMPASPTHSPAGPGQAAFDPGVPAAVGALVEAMEGGPATVPVALARLQSAEALLADAVSMQPNQLFMSRQMVLNAPGDPSALAASWMAMIRTYGEQRAALAAQSRGRHVPASLFQSDAAPRVLREGSLPQQLMSEVDAWRFAVYAWGGEKLVLRVVTLDPDEDDGPSQRPPRVALRLEVHLADLGKVIVQLVPTEGGFVLEIGAAQAGAMQHMRALLPEIGVIASRCAVRILRVRLMRQLPAPGIAQPDRMGIAMLTAPVFKAMADVAVLLSQPLASSESSHGPTR